MKSVEEQLSTYKSVHLNPTNIKTHFVGIPLIIWAIMIWLSLVELPIMTVGSFPMTLALIIFPIVLIYYFLLNANLAIGQLLFFIPTLYTATLIAQMPNAGWIAASVFFVGWVFQFIGHYYEKAKPAFVDDLNQLLIGPLFIMAELFFMLDALKSLDKIVTKKAIEKRRTFENNRKEPTPIEV